jgi:hypothetical protein
MKPDNDIPKMAGSFVNIADRRAWLDSLPDDRVRITTTPTRKRLTAANDNLRLSNCRVRAKFPRSR